MKITSHSCKLCNFNVFPKVCTHLKLNKHTPTHPQTSNWLVCNIDYKDSAFIARDVNCYVKQKLPYQEYPCEWKKKKKSKYSQEVFSVNLGVTTIQVFLSPSRKCNDSNKKYVKIIYSPSFLVYWTCGSWSSGLWHCIVLQEVTNTSGEHISSIFRISWRPESIYTVMTFHGLNSFQNTILWIYC